MLFLWYSLRDSVLLPSFYFGMHRHSEWALLLLIDLDLLLGLLYKNQGSRSYALQINGVKSFRLN